MRPRAGGEPTCRLFCRLVSVPPLAFGMGPLVQEVAILDGALRAIYNNSEYRFRLPVLPEPHAISIAVARALGASLRGLSSHLLCARTYSSSSRKSISI